MKNYDHKKIEPKWQKYWLENGFYQADDSSDKEKRYILGMFPYPSGAGLHMGHMMTYTPTDIYSRYLRMNDYEVLHPIGWDAFGLPAENYAIKTGVHPRETTNNAIENFKRQLRAAGFSHDWSREIGTHDPEYYKWTQWFFLLLYKNGLAYKAKETVNWCDSCKTVLAREQVEGGECERCGSKPQQKELEQWFFRITNYADRLLDGLDEIDWPESTKTSQRNWIGRSEGGQLEFSVKDTNEKIPVFTTRPDTVYGATYLILAPEHGMVEELKEKAENKEEVSEYVDNAKKKQDLERMAEDPSTSSGQGKTGVQIKGVSAINPATGEEIPVYVADYVLMEYGTGAIMAVPAHDERDHAFAKKYNLPIRYVVAPHVVDKNNPPKSDKPTPHPRKTVHALVRDPETGKYLALDWQNQSWVTFVVGGVEEGEDLESAARREVREETGYTDLKLEKMVEWPVQSEYFAAHKDENRVAHAHAVFFELQSEEKESISKEEQQKHVPTWVDINSLPENFVCSELEIWLSIRSEEENRVFTGEGVLINSGEFTGEDNVEAKEKITKHLSGEMKTTYRLRDWLISRQRYWGAPIPIVYDPEGNPHPVPEKHLPWLLPDDVEFRPTGIAPLEESKELQDRVKSIFGEGWTPEVDTMDTFVCSSWYYFRYTDPKNDEKFASEERMNEWLPVDLYVGGAEHAVMHLLYARFFTKVLYDLGYIDFDEPFSKLRHQGVILAEDGSKMSKSKGNIVNPDEEIDKYGADTVRMFQMFLGPLEDSKPWDSKNLIGVRRFLERVWRLQEKLDENTEDSEKINTLKHKTIKKVTEDIEVLKFNTAISQLMIFVNALQDEQAISKEVFTDLVKILAPFAPHVTEELWANIEGDSSVHHQDWPSFDENAIEEEKVNVAIQINGKVREEVEVEKDASEDDVFAVIPQHIMDKWVGNKEIKKKIYVPGKIFNIVVEE